MSWTCAYKNCYHVRKGVSSVTSFAVPDDHRQPVWLKHAGWEIDVKYKKRFCELHFYDKDFLQQCCRKLLVKTAYPKPYSASVCSCTETALDSQCKELEVAHIPATKVCRKKPTVKPKIGIRSNEYLMSAATVKNLDFDSIAIDQNFSLKQIGSGCGSTNRMIKGV